MAQNVRAGWNEPAVHGHGRWCKLLQSPEEEVAGCGRQKEVAACRGKKVAACGCQEEVAAFLEQEEVVVGCGGATKTASASHRLSGVSPESAGPSRALGGARLHPLGDPPVKDGG
jgi:hypothetical protein